MAELSLLNPNTHQDLKIDQNKVEEIGADLHMIPVVVSEFMQLIVHFPILFTKKVDTGQFSCVCLTGLQEGENLFWQNASFHAIYIPLNVTRHPFFVGQDESLSQNQVICINTECDSVSKSTGQALFDDIGQPTQFLTNAQNKLAQLLEGEKQTAAFIDSLNEFELLTPLSLDITYESGEKAVLRGLYTIDEDKLNQLDSASLAIMYQREHLQLSYTQIASLGQIYALINMKNQRKSQPSAWLT